MNDGRITQRSAYLKQFCGEITKDKRHEEALKLALEIRKFEIDLYWRRAAYFWAFIAAAFAGYFLLQKEQGGGPFEATFVLSCVGFIFSLAWYFVNRGSKAWQRNWETHVDMLEDEITGPLYKMTLSRSTYRFWRLTDGYPFSPSKINHILGVFVIVVWLLLVLRTLAHVNRSNRSEIVVAIAMSIITLCAATLLPLAGRTTGSGGVRDIDFEIRRYKNE